MFRGYFRFLLIFSVILGGIMLLGTIEEPDSPPEPWLPRPFEKKVTREYNEKFYKQDDSRPWDSHKRQDTEEWNDFLEELENRGYDLWDPEAEDIWTNYN
jgi:hypothetical protein